jgi:hypothetical protein
MAGVVMSWELARTRRFTREIARSPASIYHKEELWKQRLAP